MSRSRLKKSKILLDHVCIRHMIQMVLTRETCIMYTIFYTCYAYTFCTYMNMNIAAA